MRNRSVKTFKEILIYNLTTKMSNIKQFLLQTMLCGLLLSLALHATAAARISLSTKNKPVREVIRTIEKTSDYRFFYNDDLPGLGTNVSIQVEGGSINAVMNQLALQADIAYFIRDNNQIVLSVKADDLQQTDRRIDGTVNDERGDPVAGVNIVEKGTANGTVTDMNGNFSLEVANNAILQISFVGYIAQEISVSQFSGGGG
jgi:hypothetical protein